jgi:cyclic pyranopterin phosphate synthase
VFGKESIDMLTEPHLADNFGRRFPYLRLSVTDVCNFSCSYCLPDGYKKTGCESFLDQEEIVRLVQAFAALGVWKIRLTGGEPTVRPDFIQIAQRVASVQGIKNWPLRPMAISCQNERKAITTRDFGQSI